MRIMGIDFGDKKIGIAVSDQLGWTAQGVETIVRQPGMKKDLDKIKALALKYEVEKVVVGLPRNMDGTTGPQGEKVLHFADKVRRHLGLPVETWDERLSTVAAERLLIHADISRAKRRKVIDKMAASIILQGYLDAHNSGN
ncbi:Holliday junction resolvase RuvX [Desulfallas thermosapovorans]|uniref:Putative pre-16S rRNA nuclease n=1 Tax=Desulfallas thermosapovorans DSM 6562 TaxID=1121431 RepID=A0A5S4ZQU2_9FIRM|nr:Holliday junction resolvase RuvX [Desulfallas thermosapovorans]TYO95082.1 putative Holliday junction resolvase [Desulfallas thermosapovorans DSM 6562]